MKIATDFADAFGDDIRHLHGNLYRVRRSRIRLAPAGVAVESGRLVYGNPRWYLNKQGSPEAKGLESSKMEELRTSIQNTGLDNPIRLRPVEGDDLYLEVVNGERRFRCIEEMCDSDASCHDSASGEAAPAAEVYEWVDCRIEELDDRDALGIALKTNETSEVIGDLASIQVVKTMREAGYDDQDILVATGKSVSWLRETNRIIGLDEVCLGHFEAEQITRKAALQLALIEDAEERISTLEQVVSMAQMRHASRMSKLDKDLERAEAKEEIAEAASKVAKEIGDEDQAAELEGVRKKASEKAKKIREDHGKASSRGAKADASDVKKASKKSVPKPLPAIESEYLEKIESIIESEGYDDEGDSYGINLEILVAVCGVVRGIVEGDREILEVLMAHCPLNFEESSEEYAEEGEEDFLEESSDEEDEEDSYDDGSSEDGEVYYYGDEEEEELPPELDRELRGASSYEFENHDD